jgi:SAM-dependent methyltransferase
MTLRAHLLSARKRHREEQSNVLPTPPDSFSGATVPYLPNPRLRDGVARILSLPAVKVATALGLWGRGVMLEFHPDYIVEGERWSKRSAMELLRKQAFRCSMPQRVLVQGCGRGTGLPEFFLRAGVPNVEACDPLPMSPVWGGVNRKYVERYDREVDFTQSPVEALCHEDASFDVVSSEAVYEHISSLEQAVAETYRVLRPGGFAFHGIGPLYSTYGGDHCSGEVKFEDGFDHLLLDDDTYRHRVDDDKYFSRTSDPCCNFWAKRGIFSFARAEDYVFAFERLLSRRFLLVVISDAARKFSLRYPQRWRNLIEMGHSESDLLVKSLYVCYQRRP